MSKKLTEHDIVSLYQQGATEQPPAELDQHILHSAQQAAHNVSEIKTRRFYHTWYGQLATAASFVVVALLYFQNPEHYETLPSVPPELQNNQAEPAIEAIEVAPQQQNQASASAKAKQKRSQQDSMQLRSKAVLQDEATQRFAVDAQEVEIPLLQNQQVQHMLAEIDTLIAQQKRDQAVQLLHQLGQKYPALKHYLTQRYSALLQPKP